MATEPTLPLPKLLPTLPEMFSNQQLIDRLTFNFYLLTPYDISDTDDTDDICDKINKFSTASTTATASKMHGESEECEEFVTEGNPLG
ncbi:MAG: hypothetical protein IT321_14555 [Anaerolineae bacterium]|nr:hypothetical protein [Anaerolineae bacterium]